MTGIAMLGTGLIGSCYTQALHGGRSRDHVDLVYSRSAEKAAAFASTWNVARSTTNLAEAVNDPGIDVVVVALPNDLHEQAVTAAAGAGKAVLCTKPLGRNAAEGLRMLRAVEDAGVFHGYLEDLVYPPKTLKGLQSVQAGDLGRVLWVRSRETHPGPHSDWFFDRARAGGGAIIDMGCHCIEIARSFIGKEVRPVEVVCWGDTQVHPIESEDHAVGMVRYENGAIGQFEVSWAFRGGMDLRDEVAGTEGTLWLNHWLRTGMEMYSAKESTQYVAEKSESSRGWMFPVGDEVAALGYTNMFADMLDAFEQGHEPAETFYDGYVVNAIMDASYRSIDTKRWEPIDLPLWHGQGANETSRLSRAFDKDHELVKRERMPDGKTKLILRNTLTGEISQRVQ
ncbi:Gfo/Idh/MocA family protein [Allorhodopirellula solitaria]|uniref:1,5-anhydro-D-fructose reductase n=1 Tax=Allorhodopirellula solitaria TaxID=2527987 RepID=A0A5C5WZB7_9BACT|nr:Gfo/Idh/MocA family oxidoreductase [Allorhodopirellula solitaria]TWT55978.1 1,5-anhydro-D-fructose reductase [Allorhodopirellula solitaria]